MKKDGNRISLSATDLVGHLNCAHLTELDFAVANGRLETPKRWDPFVETLRERGARHEQRYIDHLKASGLAVTTIEGVGIDREAVSRTREAMMRGDEVILQGAFRCGEWVGRTDVLLRVNALCALGPWSYEVVDAKLARETRGGTVLQLCLYADLVADVQGSRPEQGYVVVPYSGYEPQAYRMNDYGAYFRRVRDSLTAAITSGEAAYPDPCEHCDICRWQERCDRRRREDDHLSLVANATKLQIEELKRQGIETMAALAAMPLPLAWKPSRGARTSYERIREQARLQVEGRQVGKILYEFLPVAQGFGLARLPEPSPGDVFFDLEGDPFVGESGLEYLFGYAFREANGTVIYRDDWALTRESERAAFERFIDFIVARLEAWPDLHIYHFAPYEPAALKRLMGRYASREAQLDSLLRAERFVDLYSVVRNGLRAGVESYSIKKLEALYGYARGVSLTDANRALFKVEAHLELDDFELISDDDLASVAGYNRDDCLSTRALHDWLEDCRRSLIAQGTDISRPEPKPGEASERLTERQQRIDALAAWLTEGVPADPAERTPEQHGRWLLANFLDWHRREQKALWWEHYRLCDLAVEELFDEREGLSGLAFVRVAGGTTRAPIHRYRFPPQENNFRGGEDLFEVGGRPLGSVAAIAIDEGWIEIKKRMDRADHHPEAIFGREKIIGVRVLEDSLERIAEHVAGRGIEGDGQYRAARDILIRALPRLGGQPIQIAGETALQSALRIATAMTAGVFPIQGPPGAGKTYTGARMICALVAQGRTVGVTAISHKVIRNILDEVISAADEMAIDIACVQKPKEPESDLPRLRFIERNEDLFGAIRADCDVAGATAFAWASPHATDAVDILFIDEAAQMSLADVLAASQAARSVVLLGDPQQLEQPMLGSHPEGTDVSALHHILHGEQTIPPDRGLFLAETWRLHPDICAFTSELFYAGRLHSRPGLEAQRIRSSSRFSGAGLRYVAVPTTGNQSSSPEEADCVLAIVEEILGSNATWIDAKAVERSITLADILVIAPYNAQTFELRERLPGGRIGTVDKFQGQEAPIVIYSLTTSSYEDAPRGMEFLYSLNRLNVATSRAKCLCILVASSSIFEAQCRTPRQIQLANAFCRYLEMAAPPMKPPSARPRDAHV